MCPQTFRMEAQTNRQTIWKHNTSSTILTVTEGYKLIVSNNCHRFLNEIVKKQNSTYNPKYTCQLSNFSIWSNKVSWCQYNILQDIHCIPKRRPATDGDNYLKTEPIFKILSWKDSVATYFECGWIYYIGFVHNLLLFPMVNEFWKSVRFWQSYRHLHYFGSDTVFVSTST